MKNHITIIGAGNLTKSLLRGMELSKVKKKHQSYRFRQEKKDYIRFSSYPIQLTLYRYDIKIRFYSFND